MSSTPRVLLDEMFSGAIAAQLRSRGHDALAVIDDQQLVGLADDDILAHATVERRCVVTANVRDFAALHRTWLAAGRDHAGILYVVSRVFPQDRSLMGALMTGVDRTIRSGLLPSMNVESYLRRPD